MTSKRKSLRRAEILVFCLLLSISYTIVTGSPQERDQNYRLSSQGPMVTLWEFFYGGTGDDAARGIIQSSDGGFAIVGHTTSYGAGDSDGWLIKTDTNGIIEFNKTYGGVSSDSFSAIFQTPDTGYLLAGATQSFGNGANDFWIVKTDNNGDPEWNKTFGGSGSDDFDRGIQTSDGGYILTGRYIPSPDASPDAWLLKLDSTGTEEWNATYGGIRFDRTFSVIEVSSGGYLAIGRTGNSPSDPYGHDLIIYRTDANGTELWNQTYGTSDMDLGYDLIETSDGGFFLWGNSFVSGYDNELWLIKIFENGTKEWDKYFSGNFNDWANLILEVDDGYLLMAHTKSYGPGNGDNWLLKIDNDGNVLWNQTHGYESDDEFAWDMIQSSDGNFVLAGRTVSKGAGGVDAWLFKLELDEDWMPPTTGASSFVTGPVFGVMLLILAFRRKRKNSRAAGIRSEKK